MKTIAVILAVVATIILGMTFTFPERFRSFGEDGTLSALIQLTMMAVLVGSGFAGLRRDDEKATLRRLVLYATIWIGFALFLVAMYANKESFLRLGATVYAQINPSHVRTSGETVIVNKSGDGHFWVETQINGRTIRMMVDTGASDIALDPADARAIGIDVQSLNFNIPMMTAAGPSRSAAIDLETVAVGPIVQDNVQAIVMQESGGVSLLGMDFLGRLNRFQVEKDRLTLER